jgi:hypothetical protein
MSERSEPTEAARRIAVVLANVINVSALLANEPALGAFAPEELRSLFGGLGEDLRWLRSLSGESDIDGFSWPADADARIANLDADVTAWRPGEPVPQNVIAFARRALEMWVGAEDERGRMEP